MFEKDEKEATWLRWNERHKQLIAVYKLNFPNEGPDFEGIAMTKLSSTPFVDIVREIQHKDPDVFLPTKWLDDIASNYEFGIEPIPAAIVVIEDDKKNSKINLET